MTTQPNKRPALSGEEALASLQSVLTGILTRYYRQAPAAPVVGHASREALYQAIHQDAPPSGGQGMAAALATFEQRILASSVMTWHPLFLNQMFAGAPAEAVAGDALAAMLNATLATWEAAPAATVVEQTVAGWMAGLLGLPRGSSGIFVPGGTTANLLALALARDRILGHATSASGLSNLPPGAILCSQATHYSVANAARLLGIGTEGVVMVATGVRQEMRPEAFPEALAECARRGRRPFALVLTAGAPVTGGVDPLAEMVPLGREQGVHVHVDAAFGGTLSLTSRRALLRGIEGADSVTWDAHKWLHMPLPCSALLVPDPAALRQAFENPATYLFHETDDAGPVDDLGRYTPLCAKRFDALKLWLAWQAWGTDGFRQLAESRLDLTQWFHRTLSEAADFQPAYEPATPIVCFRHRAGGSPDQQDAMHRWIREQLRERGEAFINLTQLDGAQHFRAILINPLTARDHLLHLLETIRTLGREYRATHPWAP